MSNVLVDEGCSLEEAYLVTHSFAIRSNSLNTEEKTLNCSHQQNFKRDKYV
jgi:hypothetical protein